MSKPNSTAPEPVRRIKTPNHIAAKVRVVMGLIGTRLPLDWVAQVLELDPTVDPQILSGVRRGRNCNPYLASLIVQVHKKHFPDSVLPDLPQSPSA